MVKDNDGDYDNNIKNWWQEYEDCQYFSCFSDTDNESYSLEPALINANSKTEKELDNFAKTILSTKTYTSYNADSSLDNKKTFLLDWFKGKGSARKKVDSAIRIFDAEDSNRIQYPEYLKKAVTFDA